jgi:tetratricopeptide (TPR) repeat protein
VERVAQVCWPNPQHGIPADDALDVALLWLEEAVPVDGGPVRWGRPCGVAPVPFEGAGFPAFAAERDGTQAQFEYLRGALPVVSTADAGWVLDCPVWPAHRRDGQRPWSGASGAAVFCHGRLVGVAVEDNRNMDWRRLHAVPVEDPLRLSGFADLVRRHGHPGTSTAVEDVTAAAPLAQSASSSYLAQAAEGGTATAPTYEVTPAPPSAANAVAEGMRVLARLPKHLVPDPVALPPQSRMPLACNRLFTGRIPELQWLACHLGPLDEQVPTVVLAGLGGVGKSQIASEYVHRYGAFYTGGVFWVSLTDPVTAPHEVAACGGAEGMDLRSDFAALTPAQQVALVRGAWQSPLPRLLVFDNCEDEETLQRWRPSSGGCRVLVTSRRSAWNPTLGLGIREIDVLPPDDGLALLSRYRPPASPTEGQALAAIADELGQLPLALHLAGSYVSRFKAAVTPDDYLGQLRSSPAVDHRSLSASGISPTRHIQTIAATFALSVDRLSEEPARRCLLHAAYLAPGQGIPRPLLLSSLGLDDSQDAAMDLEESLQRLTDLGLVQMTADGMLRLHRLVAAFVQDRLGTPESLHRVESEVWAHCDGHAFGGTPATRAALEPHLRVLAERALPRRDLAAAALANVFGLYLGLRGDRDGSVSWLQQALSIREAIFGADTPETAKDLNDLGFAYLGGPTRVLAEPYLERARRLWDPRREATNLAATLDNLGQLQIGSGRSDLAEPYLREALDIRLREVGPDAYPTSVTIMNLSSIAKEHGDLTDAINLARRAVDIRESLDGRCDPTSTAWSHLWLSALLFRAGEGAAALRHDERALELYQAALGARHPRTLSAAVRASSHAFEQGDLAGAARLMEIAGASGDTVTDEDLLAVASGTDLNNLGFALWMTGDYTAARRLYGMALGRGGTEATTLNNLGMINERLGEYEAAAEHYRKALALLDNEGAARSFLALRARLLNNLGVSLTLGGDPGAGGQCLREALDIRRDLQGELGRDYAVTLRNIGLVEQREGRLDKAQNLFEHARDLLGKPQDPEYCRTLHLLGELRHTRGDDARAAADLRAALSSRTALDADHPDTAVTMRALAAVLLRLGHVDEACDLLRTALPVFERRFGPEHPWTIDLRAMLT